MSNQARIYEAAARLFVKRGGTQVNVRELAEAAGVARGTIYNNVPNPDSLFEEVATALANEMHARVDASFAGLEDPAHRLARGIRLFVRRAHDEPDWGRFTTRFAFTTASLRSVLSSQPARDLSAGIEAGRYRFRPEQFPVVLALVASTTIAAMSLVLEGEKTWRDAGSDAAEFVLRAIGISPEEARELASVDLPPLPE